MISDDDDDMNEQALGASAKGGGGYFGRNRGGGNWADDDDDGHDGIDDNDIVEALAGDSSGVRVGRKGTIKVVIRSAAFL